MDPIIVIAAGVVLVATGTVDPNFKDKETLAEIIKTEVSTPEPEPAKEPEPQPAKEPEPELSLIHI